MLAYLCKVLKLRKVYTIGFACDQTMVYWRGFVATYHFTSLGKEAWRSSDKAEAIRLCSYLADNGIDGYVCTRCWELRLNREDWTW